MTWQALICLLGLPETRDPKHIKTLLEKGGLMTTTLTTLLPKLVIGFDDFLQQFEAWDQMSNSNYPPYNLIKVSPNEWTLELAVAGFAKEDLSVTVHHGTLTVESVKSENVSGRVFLHKGISNRAFRKYWKLNEYVEVKNVELKDGILRISLVRDLPESEKPKQIPII